MPANAMRWGTGASPPAEDNNPLFAALGLEDVTFTTSDPGGPLAWAILKFHDTGAWEVWSQDPLTGAPASGRWLAWGDPTDYDIRITLTGDVAHAVNYAPTFQHISALFDGHVVDLQNIGGAPSVYALDVTIDLQVTGDPSTRRTHHCTLRAAIT